MCIWDQFCHLLENCFHCSEMIVLNVSSKGFLSENIIRFKFQVTEKKMKKYEKEYLLQKEQEAQLEDPVERLTVSHRNNSSSLIVVFSFGFIVGLLPNWSLLFLSMLFYSVKTRGFLKIT